MTIAQLFTLASLAALLTSTEARAFELIDYDKNQVALWVMSDTQLTNPDLHADPRLRQAHALLTFQRLNGNPIAFINHNFDVRPGSAQVVLQVDGGSPISERWDDPSGLASEAPSPRAFAAMLGGHRRLRFSVVWPGAPETATTFDISGLTPAMEPLRVRCGW